MPSQPGVFNFEEANSPLESVVKGFLTQRKENKENDALADIYEQYAQDGRDIEKAYVNLHRNPDLSPTARVTATQNLMKLHEKNVALQKEALKKTQTADKQVQKEQLENELDEKELAFLEQLEGKNLKPTEIYKQARLAGIPRTRAKDISTLYRMEGKEGRLSEGDISKQYDYEIKDLDKQIKAVGASKDKKAPLLEERKRLQDLRKNDLARFRKGDRDFTLAMHEDVAGEVESDIKEAKEEKDAIIELLNKDFPPAQYKGTTKWLPADKSPDGKEHEYKSDGKTWTQVS